MKIQQHYSAYTAEAIKAELNGQGAEALYEVRQMRAEEEFKDLHSQKALIELELRLAIRFKKNQERLG
jgi:hypothetical protein